MAIDARAVANEFLQYASDEGSSLDPLKLQKLIYFAHGWHLAIRNEPLLDEFIEAWQYGPVVPSVYHEFKRYGNGSIGEPARDLKFIGGKLTFVPFDLTEEYRENPEHLQFTQQLLKKIWETYKKFSGLTLSNLTHISGSPWDQTWSKAEGRKNATIKDEVISRYFKEQVKSREQR